jgi:hypothetical protein
LGKASALNALHPNSLYFDCIGYVVSREYAQDKIKDETLLHAKVEDFKMQVTLANT